MSAFVADRVTDGVLRQSPDLTAFRPLVRAAAQGTISSSEAQQRRDRERLYRTGDLFRVVRTLNGL